MAPLYVYIGSIIFIALLIHRHFNDDLRRFPGPFLARWTDAWKLWQTVTGWHQKPMLVRLHRDYGDVVRIGPNTLSFSHPDAIQDIYGVDKHFSKAKYYYVAAATVNGRVTASLFSSVDVAWHDNLRRAIQPAFNLTTLVQYEPFVNNTITTFIRQLDQRFADKTGVDGIVDLPRWMHWYAFDVIGELTYGQAFGCLESASDVDNILGETREFLVYLHSSGQMPWLDDVLMKNPVLLWFNRNGFFNGHPNPAVPVALKRQNERIKRRGIGKTSKNDDGRVDLLDKFLQARDKHPETITDKEVLGLGLSMVFAGSESTAISLSSLFYHLLKTPDAYSRLRAELDELLPQQEKDSLPQFQTIQKFPFLDACVKEAFRIHPAARFSADRVLPPGGATIAGHVIPGGTVVGVSAWAMHSREDIFGQDVENYNPRRWLPSEGEAEEKARARISQMNRHLFQFGSGKFNCIGQHISRLEMYKLAAALLLKFDFELAEPEQEWTLAPGTFVNVTDVDVRVRRRVCSSA